MLLAYGNFNNTENTASGLKLYRSTNGGDTWSFVRNIPSEITSVAVSSDGNIHLLNESSNIYKSTNQGASFTTTDIGSSPLVMEYCSQKDSFYYFNFDQLYRSKDGINWTEVLKTGWPPAGTTFGSTQNFCDEFVIAKNGYFYASIATTNDPYDGLYRSIDYGKTWAKYDNGVTGNFQFFRRRVWVSSKTGYLFVGPIGSGVFRTANPEFTPTSIFSPAVMDSYSLIVGPNPTATITTLTYTLKSSDNVTIEILDTQGKLLRTVVKEEIQNAGEQQRTIDLSNLLPGVYMVQVRTTSGSSVKRVVVE